MGTLTPDRLLAVTFWTGGQIRDQRSTEWRARESNRGWGSAGEEAPLPQFPLGSFARSSLAELVFVISLTEKRHLAVYQIPVTLSLSLIDMVHHSPGKYPGQYSKSLSANQSEALVEVVQFWSIDKKVHSGVGQCQCPYPHVCCAITLQKKFASDHKNNKKRNPTSSEDCNDNCKSQSNANLNAWIGIARRSKTQSICFPLVFEQWYHDC